MKSIVTFPDGLSAVPREPGIEGAASAYLDLLRAGAANLVVFAHLFLLFRVPGLPRQSGGLAVVVFFLLSGFLIAQSMMKRLRAEGPKFPGFLADRVARIMTPYVPALLVVAIVDTLFVDARLGGSGIVAGPIAFVGNLLMLQDYPVFQLLEAGGVNVPWRIRPYNTAEPFWTVAIEMWIYIAIGAIFFTVFSRDRLRLRWFWPLLLLSAPVLVWNAAAGGGKSLSLIWLFGALAGVVLPRLACLPLVGTRRWFAVFMFGFGAAALVGHVRKFGFDPYELQAAILLALLVFAPFVYLQTIRRETRRLVAISGALASYSYSLYLIHNTSIAAVWSVAKGNPLPWALAASVLLAHAMGLLLYWYFERHHRRVSRWLQPRLEAAMSFRASKANTDVAAAAGSNPHLASLGN